MRVEGVTDDATDSSGGGGDDGGGLLLLMGIAIVDSAGNIQGLGLYSRGDLCSNSEANMTTFCKSDSVMAAVQFFQCLT